MRPFLMRSTRGLPRLSRIRENGSDAGWWVLILRVPPARRSSNLAHFHVRGRGSVAWNRYRRCQASHW